MLINRRAGKEYGIFRYAALFSEIRGRLDALMAKYPGNMRLDVMGYTNEGREMFLVTLAADVSDDYIARYAAQRLELVKNPRKALDDAEKAGQPLPIMISCGVHGNEISGTDGMFTFIDEVLGGPEKDRYLKDCVILISICHNPDGRCRGLDILNGHFYDLNREWMAQRQPETRAVISGCLQKFFPAIMADIHGYMASGNILINACTPPHNPHVEYDIISPHNIGDSRSMARTITERTFVECDIAAEKWEDGWDDYSPVYTEGYTMCIGVVSHTLEMNFPSEEGAYIAHCSAIGVLEYVHEHKEELYKDQCRFYLRGVENVNNSPFHTDYYIIKNDNKLVTAKTINQLMFNGISVYTNANGDYAVPLAQPLRPLIHNMLWHGEDISDLIESCYDVSFYSYSVMRGLSVHTAEKDAPEAQGLKELTGPVEEKCPAVIKKVTPRIVAVGESGAVDEILEEAGYSCHFIPFSELNTGYRIDPSKYDIMVVGGSKLHLWEDGFDDYHGIGYQNSWGLRERGRKEVIRAASEFKKLVMFAYSGVRLNEAIKRLDVKEVEAPKPPEGARDTILSVPNGSFRMALDVAAPLCEGYNEKELFYLVAPIAFEKVEGHAAIHFDKKDSFVNGFNKRKGELDGHIAAVHKTDGEYGTVLFGFDPAYRGYTDGTFGLLLNAVKILS